MFSLTVSVIKSSSCIDYPHISVNGKWEFSNCGVIAVILISLLKLLVNRIDSSRLIDSNIGIIYSYFFDMSDYVFLHSLNLIASEALYYFYGFYRVIVGVSIKFWNPTYRQYPTFFMFYWF